MRRQEDLGPNGLDDWSLISGLVFPVTLLWLAPERTSNVTLVRVETNMKSEGTLCRFFYVLGSRRISKPTRRLSCNSRGPYMTFQS